MKSKHDEAVQVSVFMGWTWLIGTFICSQPILGDILGWFGCSASEVLMYQSFGTILFGVTAFMSSDGMRWLSGHKYIKKIVVWGCNAVVYALFLLFFILQKIAYAIARVLDEKFSAVESARNLFRKYETCPSIIKGIIAAISVCAFLQIIINLYGEMYYDVIAVVVHMVTSIISVLGLICALSDTRKLCVNAIGSPTDSEQVD